MDYTQENCSTCIYRTQAARYRGRLRRQLILDIVNYHAIHGPSLAEVAEYYGYAFSTGQVAVFVLKLSPKNASPAARSPGLYAAEQLLRHALDNYGVEFELCFTEDFLTGLLSLTDRTENWKRMLGQCFQQLRQDKQLAPFHLILGQGSAASDADSLCESFRAAMNALELGVMYGYDRIYDCTALDEILPLDSTVLSPLHQAVLQDLLSARNPGQLKTWLDALFSELSPVFALHPVQAFRLPREIMQRADSIVRGLPGAELFREGNLLDTCVTLSQEQQMLNDLFQRFCRAGASSLSPAISLVQSHIALHFRETLTLDSLSTLSGLNPQYLSTLYRQETGQTITQHIKSLRILAAQSLLRSTQLSVDQIAQQVGYEDFRYFSRVFQQVTGKTPSGYRKEL